MFWLGKAIKEEIAEPKEITLVDRIVDILNLKGSKASYQEWMFIKEEVYRTSIWSKSNIWDCILMDVAFDNVTLYVQMVQSSYSKETCYHIINVEVEGVKWKGIPITKGEFERIKVAVIDNIENEFTKKLFPFKYPELEKTFRDVQEIQEGEEQVAFVLQRVQEIRWQYQKEASELKL